MMSAKRGTKSCFIKHQHGRNAGFSLLELLIALFMFGVIAASAFGLISQHQPLFNQQQNLAGLNIAMRNAVAQLQLDVANAGSGYYTGINIPNFPIGVTLLNNVVASGSDCHNATTFVYGSNCFDTLNIIISDPNTPPSHPSDIGSNCVSTTSSTLFANPVGTETAAQLAAQFHSGDQLLLVKSDGSQMTTTILTRDGQVSGSKVNLQHNPTGTDGTNTSSNDPLGISTNANNQLGTSFCSTDWILRMSPITYNVDTSTATDPKLQRTQNATTQTLVENIIGFKVGAALFNSGLDTDSTTYNFDSSTYSNGGTSSPYNYTLVRSVMISMIGRTPPVTDPTYTFRNSFDQGPYEVQGTTVVVNPRNLSMTDN
jgi:prepilin-type N-terminal cleavage/methylation domain-containing protein